MKDKTLTDILLIYKGWYNKEKYKSSLEAANAYYHKYYGCEDITLDKNFASHLFLIPLALEIIKLNPMMAKYILEPSTSLFDPNRPFSDVLYERLLSLIAMTEHNTFDLSEYEQMFAKAEACNYEDETVGII